MGNQKLWYGFLDAGAKSSPVVRDFSIDPGIPDALYLYSMKSGIISRYKASIVESKLRDLTPDEEKKFMAELDAGFKKVRKEFKAPVSPDNFVATPSKPAAKSAAAASSKNDDIDLAGVDSDDSDMDIDTEFVTDDSDSPEEDDDSEMMDDDA